MEILFYIQLILFIPALICVAYLFLFAFYSMLPFPIEYKLAKDSVSFIILIPAYKEDKIILNTIKNLLNQDYPNDKFDIVVISDSMQESTNMELSSLPIILIKSSEPLNTKANAINYALDKISDSKKIYESVIILDADNIVDNNFLRDISNAVRSGAVALQAHRVSKNNNSSVAILDTISEEINNSIFRQGHVKLGLSSALSGSGMAFDYEWFCKNFKDANTAGEDKELEIMLLEQGIFINYLSKTYVYDEKVSTSKVFYNQRRRWLAAQAGALKVGVQKLPRAIKEGNIDLIDKIFQWMMPPRVLLLAGIFTMAILLSFIAIGLAIKWWLLLLMLFFAFAFAVPDNLIDKNFNKALYKLPLLTLMMLANMFRLRGVNKKFIHTNKDI